MTEDLVRKIGLLPERPGVYLFRDRRCRVLYVGKARNLRARVRQYLSGHDERPHVPHLLRAAVDVEVVVVCTEQEALILESTLIKKHRPRYNVRLTDDSNFLHLRIDLSERWPRWRVVRRIEPGRRVRHFGPFASASRARATLEHLGRTFPLRTCSDRELRSRSRPCLLHEMGRCLAPCADLADPEEYAAAVRASIAFLEGRAPDGVAELRRRMFEAAEREDFEEAARLRDLVRALEASTERQHVAATSLVHRDAWGLHREGRRGAVALFPMRAGRLHEAVVRGLDRAWEDDARLLSAVLADWYAAGEVPEEVLLPWEPADRDALEEFLRERRGRAVRVVVPRRGERRRLVEMAVDNARSAFERREAERDRLEQALEQLARALRLPAPPRRIECIDNSNLQGSDPVAALAVLVDGRPERRLYRRYRVKTVEGADDFATMAEIVGRRLRRGLEEGDLPDLLVVDGGHGQLRAALRAMAALGIRDQRASGARPGPRVAVVGLAKPRAERARGEAGAVDKVVLPGARDPLRLPPGSPALRLLQLVRDQAHEAAVRYHRRTRRRTRLRSRLEDLPGVGPARRRALLRHFGSARAVREASEEELARVPGIGPALARRIAEALRGGDA